MGAALVDDSRASFSWTRCKLSAVHGNITTYPSSLQLNCIQPTALPVIGSQMLNFAWVPSLLSRKTSLSNKAVHPQNLGFLEGLLCEGRCR